MTAELFFQLFHQYGLILVCAVIFCEYMNLPGFPAGVIMPSIGVLIAQSELSLVLTVALSVVFGVLGIIFAIMSKKGDRMDSQAKAGLILSIIGVAATVLIIIFFVVIEVLAVIPELN